MTTKATCAEDFTCGGPGLDPMIITSRCLSPELKTHDEAVVLCCASERARTGYGTSGARRRGPNFRQVRSRAVLSRLASRSRPGHCCRWAWIIGALRPRSGQDLV